MRANIRLLLYIHKNSKNRVALNSMAIIRYKLILLLVHVDLCRAEDLMVAK